MNFYKASSTVLSICKDRSASDKAMRVYKYDHSTGEYKEVPQTVSEAGQEVIKETSQYWYNRG